jgi:protein ImuB
MGLTMFACLFVPDFSVQAVLRTEPYENRIRLRQTAVVVTDGSASLQRVAAMNNHARLAGVEIGMTKLQVESCGISSVRKRMLQNEESAQAALLDCAHSFSPVVESTAPGAAILDLAGTEKLFGPPDKVACLMTSKGEELGFELQVAVAANPDSSFHAAKGFRGITVIPLGEEPAKLAPLPVDLLSPAAGILEILDSWGIHTLQSLAMLPPVPLVERLGQEGLRLQKLALGEVTRTLAPVQPALEFVERFEFEVPIETIESLSFILNRLLQQLCARLSSRALATNELQLTLLLAIRYSNTEQAGESYQRVWRLPLPTTNSKMLFRLVCLDLETQQLSAPISEITIRATPVKPRFTQEGIFATMSPEPEKLEIAIARIRGIAGSEDGNGIASAGLPRVLDTHKPDAFDVVRTVDVEPSYAILKDPTITLRMFRPAVNTSVELRDEKPISVVVRKRCLSVIAASGPWHTSGNWWDSALAWMRDEWDVALKTKEGISLYRIYFDQLKRQWFLEGSFD